MERHAAPSVRIHGYPISTWTRTAQMTCVEKGIGHELIPVARFTAEHAVLHPFRRMPILEYDGQLIAESLAINCHLDEAFPGPSLQPSGHAERARMRLWMGICGDYVFRDVVRGIPRDREPRDEELGAARSVLEIIDGLIAGDAFLAGEAISLADLYLAPQISNCREKAPELLGDLDALGSWAQRIGGRDSFTQTAYDATAL